MLMRAGRIDPLPFFSQYHVALMLLTLHPALEVPQQLTQHLLNDSIHVLSFILKLLMFKTVFFYISVFS